MDVLLISADHNNRVNNFPWGVLAVGSYLTNVRRRQVYLLDASLFSKSEFKLKLNHLLPKTQLVGIGCLSTDTPFVKELVDYIKESALETKIIVGGPHAVLEPEQTCRYKNIDFVAYTDGELTTSRLIEELAKSNPDYESVPGLVYKANGELRKTARPDFVGFYDIDYNLFPQRVRATFSDYIQLLTGRGCSYRCRFCYNSVVGQTFHPRPIEGVIQELEKLVSMYNPKVVYFRDEDFFQKKQRIADFIRLYKEKKFTFHWRATCRANYFNDRYINHSYLKELEGTNCETLKMGLESGTQRVLNYLNKGIRIDSIKRAVCEIAKSKTIQGNYSFMIGLPHQTVREYMDTIKLIIFILEREPNAHIIGPQYFRMYPGGSLYEEIVKEYGYTKPTTFEGWAKEMRGRTGLSVTKNEIKYPWIPPKGKYLILVSMWIARFYMTPIKSFLTPKGLVMLPFAILVKIRIKTDWYGCLCDIFLLSKIKDLFIKLYYLKRRLFSTSA